MSKGSLFLLPFPYPFVLLSSSNTFLYWGLFQTVTTIMCCINKTAAAFVVDLSLMIYIEKHLKTQGVKKL